MSSGIIIRHDILMTMFNEGIKQLFILMQIEASQNESNPYDVEDD